MTAETEAWENLKQSQAALSWLPFNSGDGYSYGGGAILVIGDKAIPLGEGYQSGKLGEELARRWNGEGPKLSIPILSPSATPQMAIKHPTGSEEFAMALERLGVPAPWRLCDEEVGEVLAENGAIVCQVHAIKHAEADEASQLAMWIMLAVNTLAGFKAVVP